MYSSKTIVFMNMYSYLNMYIRYYIYIYTYIYMLVGFFELSTHTEAR